MPNFVIFTKFFKKTRLIFNCLGIIAGGEKVVLISLIVKTNTKTDFKEI